MRELRILIVDDEPLARELLRRFLDGAPGVGTIAEAATGREAVRSIEDSAPDLVFLDVQMPEGDGFSVVRDVGVDRMPPVVFVTAHGHHALRAFGVHAVDYLLKPFEQERCLEALGRVRNLIQRNEAARLGEKVRDLLADVGKLDPPGHRRRFVVKNADRVTFLSADDVDWIEAAGDYVRLHCGPRRSLVHVTMHGLEDELDPRFVRIHRSTIVNRDRVAELQPHFNGEYFVVLRDGTRLKLSRTYRDNLVRLLDERR